jgi:hypothetical protein
MTAHSNKKQFPETYSSSRDWAESVISRIKQIQDEYLDYYSSNKKEATEMLKLLNKLTSIVEKKL